MIECLDRIPLPDFGQRTRAHERARWFQSPHRSSRRTVRDGTFARGSRPPGWRTRALGWMPAFLALDRQGELPCMTFNEVLDHWLDPRNDLVDVVHLGRELEKVM